MDFNNFQKNWDEFTDRLEENAIQKAIYKVTEFATACVVSALEKYSITNLEQLHIDSVIEYSLIGGNKNDVIIGRDGDDYLYAGSLSCDNDEKSHNVLNGGKGNDHLFGAAGFDTLIGGDGKDYLSGEDNIDILIGGEGADLLEGGNGYDLYDVNNRDFVFDSKH